MGSSMIPVIEEMLETPSLLCVDPAGKKKLKELFVLPAECDNEAKGTMTLEVDEQRAVKRVVEYLCILKDREMKERECVQRQLNEAMVQRDMATKDLTNAKAKREAKRSERRALEEARKELSGANAQVKSLKAELKAARREREVDQRIIQELKDFRETTVKELQNEAYNRGYEDCNSGKPSAGDEEEEEDEEDEEFALDF